MTKVGIIGAGTWGTTLAQVLTDNKIPEVTIYSLSEKDVSDINSLHRNMTYFPDYLLSENIKATSSLEEVVMDKDMLILSIPTVAMRDVLNKIEPLLKKKVILVNTAKGFDPSTRETMINLIREVIPSEKYSSVVSLIGPSHAEEVIERDLTCICSVCRDEEVAREVAKIFSNNYLRVYTNTDEIGSEICAALKNAIAIASGILEGLGYGDNARAALCCRGIFEIARVVLGHGGHRETILGLTGLGDLVVTCYSFHSRNFCAGLEIGKDDDATHFLETNTKTVEGLKTIQVAYDIAKEEGLELPIIDALYRIIYEGAKPSQLVDELMTRPLKAERIKGD